MTSSINKKKKDLGKVEVQLTEAIRGVEHLLERVTSVEVKQPLQDCSSQLRLKLSAILRLQYRTLHEPSKER